MIYRNKAVKTYFVHTASHKTNANKLHYMYLDITLRIGILNKNGIVPP